VRLAQETSTSPLNALLMLMRFAVHVKLAQRQSTGSLPALESQTLSAALALHAQQMSISRQLAVRHQTQFVQHALPALVDSTKKRLVAILLIQFARLVRLATVQLNTKPQLALPQRIPSALIEILMAQLHVLLGPTTILPSLDVLSVLMVKHQQQALKVILSVPLALLVHSLALKEAHLHQLALIAPQARTRKKVLDLVQSVPWVSSLLLVHPRAQSAPLVSSPTQLAQQLVLIVLQASTQRYSALCLVKSALQVPSRLLVLHHAQIVLLVLIHLQAPHHAPSARRALLMSTKVVEHALPLQTRLPARSALHVLARKLSRPNAALQETLFARTRHLFLRLLLPLHHLQRPLSIRQHPQ
jgi:hypothetical protein